MSALTPLLAPSASVPPDAQQRFDERNHMFVMAVLYFQGGSAPVRVRNMSRSGALIECAAMPPEGSPVRLSRGSLSVRGSLAWRSDDRAGIRFDDPVAVADWLPCAKKSSGQQCVDTIVQAYRRAKPSIGPKLDADAPLGVAEVARQMVELKAALDQAAGELAKHSGTAAQCPTALQAIDVAAQKLGSLATFLANGGYGSEQKPLSKRPTLP